MNTLREKWVSEHLQSLDGIQRAEIPDSLATKIIENRLRQNMRVSWYRSAAGWTVAASIAMLILLNVFTWVSYPKNNRAGSSVANEYFAYTQTPDL